MLKRLLGVGIVLAAVAFPAWGVVTVVQHSHNGHNNARGDLGTTAVCTLSATGSGHNIIVGAAEEGGIASVLTGVLSVTDNVGNVYVPATAGYQSGNYQRTEIWHSLGASAGVTTITVQFWSWLSWDNIPSAAFTYKSCFAYDVSGALTFDTAGSVNDSTCTSVCSGASVTTATTAGFVLGVIIMDPIDQNPNSGNEFTSGGDSDFGGWSAAASLVSSSAGAHQPAWHATDTWAKHFSASTAAYKQ